MNLATGTVIVEVVFAQDAVALTMCCSAGWFRTALPTDNSMKVLNSTLETDQLTTIWISRSTLVYRLTLFHVLNRRRVPQLHPLLRPGYS